MFLFWWIGNHIFFLIPSIYWQSLIYIYIYIYILHEWLYIYITYIYILHTHMYIYIYTLIIYIFSVFIDYDVFTCFASSQTLAGGFPEGRSWSKFRCPATCWVWVKTTLENGCLDTKKVWHCCPFGAETYTPAPEKLVCSKKKSKKNPRWWWWFHHQLSVTFLNLFGSLYIKLLYHRSPLGKSLRLPRCGAKQNCWRCSKTPHRLLEPQNPSHGYNGRVTG